MIKTKKAGLLLSPYSVKVQQTPQFFFRWTKFSYHPAYLCEKILVIAFLLIFLEFFKVSNFGGSCGHNRALWRMGPSVIVTSSKELDLPEQHGLLLKSCPTPLLFSVVAEQPIPKEVSGVIEFLSLMTNARKALKEDGNGWTLSSRGELSRSQPFLQRARLKTIELLI